MFRLFPRRSHPMPVLAAGINALSTFAASKYGDEAFSLEKATPLLMGSVPTLAAYGYKNSVGQPFLYADDSLSYIENFLRMSFGLPTGPYPFDDAITRALDVLLILHADHEQNCSTSTVRMVASSGANIYVSVAAGVSALSGPLHGGANQAVLEMLKGIRDEGGDVKSYVTKVKDKKDTTKLMGFGHRIYKNYDPRAAIVKKHADDPEHSFGNDQLLDLAVQLEEAALSDPYFQERKSPERRFLHRPDNRRWASAEHVHGALRLGRFRLIAHFREQAADPATKINRPRQVYIGEVERPFIPMAERA